MASGVVVIWVRVVGECCWVEDWVSDYCWAKEVVVVLIWVCSQWRERERGEEGRKIEIR